MERCRDWYVRRLLASAVSLALGLSLLLAFGIDAGEGQPAAAGRSAEQATHAFVALSARYKAADTGTRTQLLGALVGAAAARRQLLATLVEDDPGTVLRIALPGALVAHLPAQVRAHIEQEVELEGALEVLHEDRADGSRYLYFLKTSTERLALHFATDPPKHRTGTRARVRGVRVHAALALASSTTSVTPLSLAIPPDTFNAQRTLVILVNFSDNPSQPYTPDTARSVVFDTVSGFDLENSFQRTWLVGDVAGWLTIPLSWTVCDYFTLARQADAAASAAGFALSAYSRHVYAFPANVCGWWGLGTIGGNPSQAWINGSLQLTVVGHEMGHNFGLYHSHSLDCGTAVVGTSCTVSEYGDTTDIMGWSSAHFNAFQKERLGWLNYGASPPITTVVGNGTYAIEAYELLGVSPKALKILKSTDPMTGARTWYYVEYRQAIGFDSILVNNPNTLNGVLIHTGLESNPDSSYLLDLTPATAEWSDAALAVGQSFSDPSSGVTITAAWNTATQAGVTVTFGDASCVRANPTATLSPLQGPAVRAGTPVTYTLSVTNNDTPSCGASSLALEASVPAGWTAAFASPALLLSPGIAASTTLQVASPTATADGLYTIGAAATNTAAPSYAEGASATYVVVGCVRANPTVALSPSQSASVQPGATVSYTVVVTNNDNPVCDASSFALQASVPAGWTAILASPSLTVSPGTTRSASLQVTSSLSATDGFYTITASAANTGGSTYTGSASATYSLLSRLGVTVSTNRSSYTRTQTVSITALVKRGGSPVSNAQVLFVVKAPNGHIKVADTRTTGLTGKAVFKVFIGSTDPLGVYTVNVTATSNGRYATATTSFTVH